MATPSLPDEPADPELRVRFTTATALVNELVEARAANILAARSDAGNASS
jgi:hypothetical protein